MNNWSFIKRFGNISHSDFVSMAQRLIAAMREHHRSLEITIIMYGGLPHTNTAPIDGIGEWTDSENKKKEILRIEVSENMPPISRELFDLAKNIQLFVRSANGTCGYMECKGLLPRHVTFSAWTGEQSEKIKKLCVEANRPSRLWFKKGGGLEWSHTHSLS